ncbi:7856_t:CDS:2 [Entrophospora sp. SA101]|nr:7856_t:CDS:2 [Entrophospora sp. SA101]
MLKKNPTKNKNSSKRARSNSTECQSNLERLLKRLTTNPPYKLTLPIDELIKPKTDYNAKLKAESQMTNLNNREKSKLIANIWNSQSSEVKQFFQILSMAANVKHKLTFNNFNNLDVLSHFNNFNNLDASSNFNNNFNSLDASSNFYDNSNNIDALNVFNNFNVPPINFDSLNNPFNNSINSLNNFNFDDLNNNFKTQLSLTGDNLVHEVNLKGTRGEIGNDQHGNRWTNNDT